jgi:hypothetical protein
MVGRRRRSLERLQNPYVPQAMLCFSLLFFLVAELLTTWLLSLPLSD